MWSNYLNIERKEGKYDKENTGIEENNWQSEQIKGNYWKKETEVESVWRKMIATLRNTWKLINK